MTFYGLPLFAVDAQDELLRVVRSEKSPTFEQRKKFVNQHLFLLQFIDLAYEDWFKIFWHIFRFRQDLIVRPQTSNGYLSLYMSFELRALIKFVIHKVGHGTWLGK